MTKYLVAAIIVAAPLSGLGLAWLIGNARIGNR